MKSLKVACFVFTLFLSLVLSSYGFAIQKKTCVLTSLQCTYSIVNSLTGETSIDVFNVCPPGCRMDDQRYYFQKKEEEIRKYIQKADAVITIRKVWKSDPLYIYTRKWNIRAIEIDASAPFDPALTGVALLDIPVCNDFSGTAEEQGFHVADHNGKSVYVWLSLSNVSKMADIIAADLKRLSPKDAGQIDKNLNGLKRKFFKLKIEYESRFVEIENLESFALTDKFVYLTDNFNIHVVDCFVKPDFYWTKEDLINLKTALVRDEIKVVIHKWEPNAPIAQIIKEAGAKLAVLDSMDRCLDMNGKVDPDGYMKIMRKNLAAIAQAFEVSDKP
ncbi:MAG: hypothetical protein C4B58_08385 [Deltaproteobacteria bacterium]|nr:MAG: hypothetical protein C4B58_08385 [Deltaproteobacteria bacterium]